MRALSPAGQQAIDDMAQRHGFSPAAVLHMLEALINARGSMAQFNHCEFGGSGQWMPGGMTMLSDMFNHSLKSRVDGLCYELSGLVASQPELLHGGSFQSQSQGGGLAYGQGSAQSQYAKAPSYDAQAPASLAAASLFLAPAAGQSGEWWGADLRWPTSTGAQNDVRYAYFAQARRLAIEVGGRVTIYDTLDHNIGGFSQQQGSGGSLSFSSQHGLIDVACLPVLGVDGRPPASAAPAAAAQPAAAPAPPAAAQMSIAPQQGGAIDIFAMIERLADLHAKGILSAEEFAAKKTELLSRL